MLRWFKSISIVGLLFGILLSLPSPALAHGLRLVVDVAEPFEVNGRVLPAGALALRTIGPYNPSQTIDEVWFGNECLGLFVAQHRTGMPSERDSVVFERNSLGRLVLVGYVLRGDGNDTAFRYRSWTAGLGDGDGEFSVAR